eukprot:TRINITY_DN3421_c1_g2_i2.p1 TRINITY_DN3421_c1_g2~~TRINITY_DN3421_c1_g2_i2.p1  ORF type:complete len:1774 (+),score=439.41 TRINITY_DN3421_c1_g2_i2:2-5323(+)
MEPVVPNENGIQNVAPPITTEKPKYIPVTPTIEWDYFLRSFYELEYLAKISTASQNLQIVSLGVASMIQEKPIEGVLSSMNVIVQSFQREIQRKLRILTRIIKIQGRILGQDKEGVNEQVFSISSQILIHTYQLIFESPQTFDKGFPNQTQTLKSFFHQYAYPIMKTVVDGNLEIGDHLRLSMCQIIQKLKEDKQSVLMSHNLEDNQIYTTINNITNDNQEKEQLFYRLCQLLNLSMNKDPLSTTTPTTTTTTTIQRDSILNLIDSVVSQFGSLTSILLGQILDFLILSTILGIPDGPIVTVVESFVSSNSALTTMFKSWHHHEEVDILNLYFSILDLIQVRLSSQLCNTTVSGDSGDVVDDDKLATDREKKIMECIDQVFEDVTVLVPSILDRINMDSPSSNSSSSSSMRLLDVILSATDCDIQPSVVHNVFVPSILGFLKEFDLRPESRDFLLLKSLNFAYYASTNKEPEKLVERTLQAITKFQNKIGRNLKNDQDIIGILLDLASLFCRRRSEREGIYSMISSQIYEALTICNNWSDGEAFKHLVFHMIRVGILAISGGMNQYKYFVFFFPPLLTRINDLPFVPLSEKEDKILDEEKNKKEDEKKQKESSSSSSSSSTTTTAVNNNVNDRQQHQLIKLCEQKNTPENYRIILVLGIIKILEEMIIKGSDMSVLLSDGFPLVLRLYKSSDMISHLIHFISRKYEVNNSFASILEFKYALDFCEKNFEEETMDYVRSSFREILEKGKRDYMKTFSSVCKSMLKEKYFVTLRNYIFGILGDLNMKQKIELCNLVSMIIDLYGYEKNQLQSILYDQERRIQEGEVINKEDLVVVDPSLTVIGRIGSHVIKSTETVLNDNVFNDLNISRLSSLLSRVVLYRNLFPNELKSNQHLSTDDLIKLFGSKFPPEVIEDRSTMNVLTSLSQRIERITNNLTKYKHVADEAIKCLDIMFNLDIPNAEKLNNNEKLKYRIEYLNNYVYNIKKNVELRNHLISNCNYSDIIWNKDLTMMMAIDDKTNLEEKFKSNLSELYQNGWVDLYTQMYGSVDQSTGQEREIIVDGANIKLKNLFKDNWAISLSIEDLRSRRNVILKDVEKLLKLDVKHPKRQIFMNIKLSLLTKEDKLESDFQDQKLIETTKPKVKRYYWIRLNSKFFKTVSTCGSNISGCYAPNGDHAEKIVENSLKSNVAIISLYEEDRDHTGKDKQKGDEIENLEVIFTDQGMYVYKLYTNSHPYDTTLGWILFFKSLIEYNFVPAIILPKHFPNTKIYSYIQGYVSPQLYGSTITYKDSFFEEHGVDSYYDFKPEKIKVGDIVIDRETVSLIEIPNNDVDVKDNKGNGRAQLLSSSTGLKPVARREKKVIVQRQKDFAGTVMTQVIKKLTLDTKFAYKETLTMFGRSISKYINEYITNGIRDTSILTIGIDLDQWGGNNKKKKLNTTKIRPTDTTSPTMSTTNVGSGPTSSLSSSSMDHVDSSSMMKDDVKQYVIDTIVSMIDEEIKSYTKDDETIQKLLIESKEHFHELYSFYKTRKTNKESGANEIVDKIKSVMSNNIQVVKMCDLDWRSQELILKWIFGNEDRVWRERGGRPGEETLLTFYNFVLPEAPGSSNTNEGPNHHGHQPFGGYVVFSEKVFVNYSSEPELFPQSCTHNKKLLSLPTRFKYLSDLIVSYSIGDWIEPDNFEIVTAWTDPRYRNIGLAVQLYVKTLKQIKFEKGNKITVDCITGSLGKERMHYNQSIYQSKYRLFDHTTMVVYCRDVVLLVVRTSIGCRFTDRLIVWS